MQAYRTRLDVDQISRITTRPPVTITKMTAVEPSTVVTCRQPNPMMVLIEVPSPSAPIATDSSALVTLMCRARSLAAELMALRLPAERHVLKLASAAWTKLAAGSKAPLGTYFGGLPNLAGRLAASLHLAAAAGGEGGLARDIAPSTLLRAVTIIDTYVVPVARALLEPVSVDEAERDARHVVDYLRATTSPIETTFERRPLLRAWQRTMSVARLDAALGLLQQAELLVDLDKEAAKGGRRFAVAAEVLQSA